MLITNWGSFVRDASYEVNSVSFQKRKAKAMVARKSGMRTPLPKVWASTLRSSRALASYGLVDRLSPKNKEAKSAGNNETPYLPYPCCYTYRENIHVYREAYIERDSGHKDSI